MEDSVFGWLPIEIRSQIFAFLRDCEDYSAASLVCVHWNKEIDGIWHNFCAEKCLLEDEEFWLSLGKDWKWILKTKKKVEISAISDGYIIGAFQFFDGIYEGELEGRFKFGCGAIKWDNGGFYKGCWKYNLKEGFGFQKWGSDTNWAGDIYIGDWKKGLRTGFGTYTWFNGDKYTGSWKNGKKDGYGVFNFSSGNKYEGKYKKDMKEGEGKFIWKTGDSYVGSWHFGERHGEGCYRYYNGDKYVGEWKRSNKEGKGRFFWHTGAYFEGLWSGGKMHGEGTYFWPDGDFFIGQWKNNFRVKGIFFRKGKDPIKQKWHLDVPGDFSDICFLHSIPKYLSDN